MVSDINGILVTAFVEGIDRTRCGSHIDGIPIIWIDELTNLGPDVRAVCAVGTTRRAEFIAEAVGRGLRFVTLVHPSAVVAKSAALGEGTFVSAGAVIGAQTWVGRHTIINRGALLGHHIQIGDYATIGPGSTIGGFCTIGSRAYVGLGATIRDRITIGEQSGVGAGAVVLQDVAPNVLVLGSPAEPLRRLPEGL